jgi:uncharacterized protein
MALSVPAGLTGDARTCFETGIVIGGETFVGDSSGCLYWPAENCLVVADMHLEKASAFAVRGQMLPPYETGATLRLLAERIAYWNPHKVVALGDSFHDRRGFERLSISDRTLISSLVAERCWTWISGNHDPGPPGEISGQLADALVVGGITFRHEPLRDTGAVEIAGHLHPQARIVRRGKSVRRRCFVTDGRRLILPSFGAMTGGLNIRDRAFSGLFNPSRLQAHMIGRSEIYCISGKHLV